MQKSQAKAAKLPASPPHAPPSGGFWVKFSSRSLQGSDQNRKKRPFPAPSADAHREGGERARKAEASGVLVLPHTKEQGLEGLPVEGNEGVEVAFSGD